MPLMRRLLYRPVWICLLYTSEAYKQVLESLAPRKVVVRTCDIGADKTVDYMKLDHEDNPCLLYTSRCV